MANLVLTTNPTTINSPVIGSGPAVYGAASTTWTVTNQSTIEGTGAGGIGIDLAGSGTITNDTGAYIYGGATGILLGSGGYVANGGTIEGATDGIRIEGAAGTVTNSGTIGGGSYGVYLSAGGTITNSGGALIAGGNAIRINGPAGGTVSNTGTLYGSSFFGVYLVSGGSIGNGSSIANGATIVGYLGGIRVGNAANTTTATVTNYGTIEATGPFSAYGIEFYNSGEITNGSPSDTSALITGYSDGLRLGINNPPVVASTVTNYGTIAATGASGGYGVRLGDGGNVRNGDANSTVATIAGSRYGIYDYLGSIANYGTISGGYGGIEFIGRGLNVVTNGASNSTAALISGGEGISLVNGTVTNFGTIVGATGIGVDLAAGGTVIDSGTIIGGGGIAVYFGGGGGGNRLALDPGYVLSGAVFVTGSANVLELGSGSTAGTLTGLGTTFTDFFGSVTVDAGAQWTLSGSNTIASGVTLTVSGTLVNAGSLFVGGDFIVDPAGPIVGTFVNSSYVSGTVALTSGAYLDNLSGATIVAAGYAVYGSGGLATVTNGGTVTATGVTAVDLAAGGRVSNGSGGVIVGYGGVAVSGNPGAISNSGTIVGTGGAAAGVALSAGGSVGNGGYIEGYTGIYIGGAPGSVSNSGTILGGTGYHAAGVVLYEGGGVHNARTGLIGGGVTAVNGIALVTNSGAIGNVSGGAGVSIAGGTIVNAVRAVIYGYDGVYAKNTATVSNSGTIIGDVGISGGGPSYAAIYLADGGFISNTGVGYVAPGIIVKGAAGTVDNVGRIVGGEVAVFLDDGGTVTNEGSIGAFGGPFFWGIAISGAGAVSNSASGYIHGGVAVYGGPATVSNYGKIVDGLPAGVYLYDGGTVINGGTISVSPLLPTAGVSTYDGVVINNSQALIAGYIGVYGHNTTTVTNSGTIAGYGGGHGFGVVLGGGTVSNAASGYIYSGVVVVGGAGTVTNSGRIVSPFNGGVYLYGGGAVVNAGLISQPGDHFLGIYIRGDGYVNNMSGGTIGATVYVTGAPATVVNAGLIDDPSYIGVRLGSPGTVVDAGTIAGTTAIYFAGVGDNRLVLDPGYALVGGIYAAAGSVNTLELGSASSVGTLTGLGTTFADFASETVDRGAQWVLSGSNTIASGVTLSNFGTLTDSGSVMVAGVFYDAGRLLVATGGSVSGVVTVGDGGSAEFAGAVSNGATVAFEAGGALVIDDLATAPGGVQTQQFKAPISGLLGGDKIRMATAGLGKYSGITAATPGTYDAGNHTTSLYLTSGAGNVATLTLDGDYAGNAFGVSLAEGGYVTIGKQIGPTSDFTGAGFGDVPIQYAITEKVLFAAMSNGTFSGFGFATGGLGTFSVVGHGDINGDGISDVVVQNPSNGQVYYAEENGLGNGQPTWVTGPDIAGFTVVGVGDIQGDDRDDLVMQNSSGRIVYYDTAHNSVVQVANAPGWNVAGVGDVNGDGYADIVIQNPTTGKIVYGDMAGGVFSGWDLVATDTLGWTAVAVADIQGDGYADVIVQDLTAPGFSHVLAADMQGGTFSGWLVATTGLSSDYVVKDTADVFGNGDADLIVQQQSTGAIYYAEEGATGFQSWGNVTNGLNSNYHVV